MEGEKIYPILISSGLITPGHYKKMGIAYWEFTWLLQRVTKTDKEVGLVYGGKPVKIAQIAKDLGKHRQNVHKALKRLKKNNYIATTKTPYGLIIQVKKIKKRYSDFATGDIAKTLHGYSENAISKEDSSKDKVIDKGDSPSGSPHNSMLTRNENEFSDLGEKILDLETGEFQEEPKKEGNKKWQNFVSFWQKKCLEAKGVDSAEVILKKDKPTYHRVKKLYNNEQIADIVDFFLASEKSKEYLTISACFSAHTINQWKQTNKSLR